MTSGEPQPEPRQVTLDNWRSAPFNRWGLRNVQALVPTVPIRRDPGRLWHLPRAERDIDGLGFRVPAGAAWRLGRWLDESFTDALLVLAGGRIVYERYLNGMRADELHILMSVSKSVTGALAGVLVQDGRLDPEAPVAAYVPEVAAGGYAGATVRQLLDMRVGIRFDEDYADGGVMRRYREAMLWKPAADPADPGDLRGFIVGLPPEGAHGGALRYLSPNADLLGWVLERASGLAFAELMSEALWRPGGAEQDAYVTVDRLGAARTAGGIGTTLRDLGRFGLMMLRGGLAEECRVISAAWVDDIRRAGDREAWRAGDFGHTMPGAAYRSQWYATGAPSDAFCAIGIHGQWLYLDPARDVVVAKLSSAPLPVDEEMDRVSLAAFEAIAAAVGA